MFADAGIFPVQSLNSQEVVEDLGVAFLPGGGAAPLKNVAQGKRLVCFVVDTPLYTMEKNL